MHQDNTPDTKAAEIQGQITEAQRTLDLLRQYQDEMIKVGRSATQVLREEVDHLWGEITQLRNSTAQLDTRAKELRLECLSLEDQLRLRDRLEAEVTGLEEALTRLRDQAANARERVAADEVRADEAEKRLGAAQSVAVARE